MNFFQPGGVRVKICGITTPADAQMAIDAGADALGFNLFPGSKRFLPLEKGAPWIAKLSGITRVAVVVNMDADALAAVRDAGIFDAIQFHGDETPDFCAAAGFPVWIRASRIHDPSSLDQALTYPTQHLLLDAWSATAYGGTGQRIDWHLARDFTAAHPEKRIILAGGLTPASIALAASTVRPAAVDVAGGVESAPGRKDAKLVRDFIKAAKDRAALR